MMIKAVPIQFQKKYNSMGGRTLDIRPYFIKSLVKKVFFSPVLYSTWTRLSTYYAKNSLDIIWSLMLLLLFSVWVLLKIPMMIFFLLLLGNIQMYFRYTIYKSELSPGIYSNFFAVLFCLFVEWMVF